MSITIHYVKVLEQKHMLGVTFVEQLEEFAPPCKLILDQATHSGFSIWDRHKRLVAFGTVDINRGQSLPQYKEYLTQELRLLISQFEIGELYHEETFASNVDTFERLVYIKHAVQDLARELSLQTGGVPASTWQQTLARPEPFNREDTKGEVLKYVKLAYPLLFADTEAYKITEDMVDALGMGIALVLKLGENVNILSALKYNKKLPVQVRVFVDEEQPIQTQIEQSRLTGIKQAIERDALYVLDTTQVKSLYEGARQYLTHRDGAVAVKVTPAHKEWGMQMLEQNIRLDQLGDAKVFWLVFTRKARRT